MTRKRQKRRKIMKNFRKQKNNDKLPKLLKNRP